MELVHISQTPGAFILRMATLLISKIGQELAVILVLQVQLTVFAVKSLS